MHNLKRMAGKRRKVSTDVHDVDHAKYKQVFQDYYKKLSDALPTSEMLPGLFSNGVITMEQKEEIQVKETSASRTSQLLDGPIWSGIKSGYPDGFITLFWDISLLHVIRWLKRFLII